MQDYIKRRGCGLASSLLNLLYPSVCPVCKNKSDSHSHSPLCGSCWTSIRRYEGPSCGVCAAPLVSQYSNICGVCLKEAPPFTRVINYGLYSDALAAAIHQLKFFGIRRLAYPLARLLLDLGIPGFEGIIPVPLSKRDLGERGFNHTTLISKVLSKELNIPLYMDNLIKSKDTLPQVGLSAKERIKNLRGVFEARGEIGGMRLLLLDDVMTTGATAKECTRELVKAGAGEVIVITLARSAML